MEATVNELHLENDAQTADAWVEATESGGSSI
jgi:hypothetical protein